MTSGKKKSTRQTLRATHPNAGVEAWYRRQLDNHIREMQKSVVYWLTANYKASGAAVAMDASPAVFMRDAMKKLAKRWTKAFDNVSHVGLIRSIPEKYFNEVEGLVMRSVARGRDLSYLTDELQKRYGITRRRAALIARDQNNKATSVMQAARQQSLGVTQGVWKHSHAGKEPRPSHVKADGKVFELSKGMYLDGKWVMPGEEINCRCTWSPVIPGLS